jgi:hypothetical protein
LHSGAATSHPIQPSEYASGNGLAWKRILPGGIAVVDGFQLTGAPAGKQSLMMLMDLASETRLVDIPSGKEMVDIHTTRLFPMAFPDTNCGVCVSAMDGKLTIVSVAGSAKAAGLVEGQIIESIGNIPGSEIGSLGARALLGGKPGTHVTITIDVPRRTVTLPIAAGIDCE